MDGNGRWAKARGLERSAGHKAGTETAREIVRECRKLGIPYLTLYTFSKENWSRPKQEVGFLFNLLREFLSAELPSLLEQSIRLNVLGEMDELPMATRQVLRHAVDKTAGCTAMNLNLALNYSGRLEILRACQALLRRGVIVRPVGNYGMPEYLRVSIGLPEQNEKCLAVLGDILGGR